MDIKGFTQYLLIKEREKVKESTTAILKQLNNQH